MPLPLQRPDHVLFSETYPDGLPSITSSLQKNRGSGQRDYVEILVSV